MAIDTGASYITGPAGPVSMLMKAIGAAEMTEGEVSKTRLHPHALSIPKLSAASSSSCSTWLTVRRSPNCPTSPSTWVGRRTRSAAQPTSSG